MRAAITFRQAATIRRQTRMIHEQTEMIVRLTARLRRIQADVELIGACIPRERRDLALSLVRDRHRIEELDETTEVGG